MIRGMEHILEKRLRELRLLSLEKKSFMDELIVAFQHLKGPYKSNGAKLSTRETVKGGMGSNC